MAGKERKRVPAGEVARPARDHRARGAGSRTRCHAITRGEKRGAAAQRTLALALARRVRGAVEKVADTVAVETARSVRSSGSLARLGNELMKAQTLLRTRRAAELVSLSKGEDGHFRSRRPQGLLPVSGEGRCCSFQRSCVDGPRPMCAHVAAGDMDTSQMTDQQPGRLCGGDYGEVGYRRQHTTFRAALRRGEATSDQRSQSLGRNTVAPLRPAKHSFS